MIDMMKCFLKFNGLIGNIKFSYVYVWGGGTTQSGVSSG